MNSSTTASAVKRSGIRSTVMFSLFNLSAVLLPTAHTLCEINSARPCPSASSRRRKYSTPFALVKANQSYQLKWISAQSSCAQSDGSLISIVGHEMTSAPTASNARVISPLCLTARVTMTRRPVSGRCASPLSALAALAALAASAASAASAELALISFSSSEVETERLLVVSASGAAGRAVGASTSRGGGASSVRIQPSGVAASSIEGPTSGADTNSIGDPTSGAVTIGACSNDSTLALTALKSFGVPPCGGATR